jgi:hypothetical protein
LHGRCVRFVDPGPTSGTGLLGSAITRAKQGDTFEEVRTSDEGHEQVGVEPYQRHRAALHAGLRDLEAAPT